MVPEVHQQRQSLLCRPSQIAVGYQHVYYKGVMCLRADGRGQMGRVALFILLVVEAQMSDFLLK
jgi:hypothetical protein